SHPPQWTPTRPSRGRQIQGRPTPSKVATNGEATQGHAWSSPPATLTCSRVLTPAITSPPVPVSTPAISITTDHSAAVTLPPPISTGPSAASSRYNRLRRVGVHQAATFAHQSISSLPCGQPQ